MLKGKDKRHLETIYIQGGLQPNEQTTEASKVKNLFKFKSIQALFLVIRKSQFFFLMFIKNVRKVPEDTTSDMKFSFNCSRL